MSKRKYSYKNQSWLKRIINFFRYLTRRIIRPLLRLMIISNRSPSLAKAGIVLPTAVMVLLVVILLTTAISLRSFNRVEQARNVRVNQAVLSAATPAIDRAKAKLQNLLEDEPPVTGTPKDDVLYKALIDPIDPNNDKYPGQYTFGDETRLEVRFDIDEDGLEPLPVDGKLEDDEFTATAWRFPVDTDNNGLYDSFTLYGIFFRNPPRAGTGFERERTPLEARTIPQASEGAITNEECAAALGTSSGIVGDSSWFDSGEELKKTFFVYTVNIPITDVNQANLLSANDQALDQGFENFPGTTSISALEYQQDRTRIPLTNNAVVYEDDLEIAPFPTFRLNGRILTNSNLIISPFRNPLRLYQVSGKYSCFYKAENSKIIVGGNVVNGQIGNTTQQNPVAVDLFDGDQQDPIDDATLTNGNDSTGNNARQVMYDTQRYARLIDALVNRAEGNVTDNEGKNAERTTLEKLLRQRTRKVPWENRDDVPEGPTISISSDGTTVDDVRPNDNQWILSVGNDDLSYEANNLPATDPEDPEIKEEKKEKLIGDRILVGNNLPFKTWDGSQFQEKYEQELTVNWPDSGDLRVRTGRVEELPDVGSVARKNNIWNNDDEGFWEKKAAEAPEAALDGVGGLRVVTGAGVYERLNSFLPPPQITFNGTTTSRTYDDPTTTNAEEYVIVWPDTMPMSPGRRPQQLYDNEPLYDNDLTNNQDAGWVTPQEVVAELIADIPTIDDWTELFDAPGTPLPDTIDPNTQKYAKGDLRMRATAVYHYAQSSNAEQTPIACISSYYDPTDYDTAQNIYDNTQNIHLSNNGIVFGPPPARPTGSLTPDATTGLFTTTGTNALSRLGEQANMVFPDGRFVNELLREAIQQTEGNRTLAQRGAIDSTLCAFGILGTPEVSLGTAPSFIPNDAIRETAFLNAREVKAMERDSITTPNIDEMFNLSNPLGTDTANIIGSEYDLSLEERYPQEIRVTQLDLNALRNEQFTINNSNYPNPEYLLPNSGIIYATRDDALPDRSDRSRNNTTNTGIDSDRSRLVSPTDYIVDPTRRPNGIMLVNGDRLARNDGNNDGQNDTNPGNLSDVVQEKGLILVSNLPVYIQGNFNRHTEQEFNDQLLDNWSNFYTRPGKNTNTGLNKNFACRRNDPRVPGCNTGDSWRQATVLADSVTLLSDSFRPGYRNEGNFDLRNNAGDVVVAFDVNGDPIKAKEARRKNGFFTNDFVTTGLTSGTRFNIDGTVDESIVDTDYSELNTFYNSSYFNNFVTPVQRRINFPEYVMEMCRKFPLSSCEPDDWVVGYDENDDGDLGDNEIDVGQDLNGDGDATDANVFERDVYSEEILGDNIVSIVNTPPIVRTRLGAGTTVNPPLEPNNQPGATDYPGDQRYARRLAFQRNHYHQLELDEVVGTPNRYTAIPLGIDASDTVQEYDYEDNNANPANFPRLRDNSLWFRTTENRTGTPDAAGDITYANNRLPYYYFDDNGDSTPDTGKRVLLPQTAGSIPLDNADQHAVCLNNLEGSQEYEVTTVTAASCSSTETGEIGSLNTTIQGYVVEATLTATDVEDDISLPRVMDTDNTANGENVWVYDLPDTIGDDNKTVNITLQGDANTIFIFRRDGDLSFGTGTNSTVRVELEGNVNPNNIFWVTYGTNGNLTFQNAPAAPANHLVTGNFLGTGTLNIGNNTQILGSRLLGFSFPNPGELTGMGVRVTAMSTQDQPLLVPVLQIRVPRASQTNLTALPNIANPNQGNDTGWMVPAAPTTFNLVVGSKDTPSRPLETNGGLQNLPRFLENWQDPEQRTNILGSFVQLGRSEYATAPYLQIFRNNSGTNVQPNSLFPDFDDFVYGSGAAGGRIAYQGAPARNWGYDVGLLSQTPDLFAQQFTLRPSNTTPDEFYREVGQDDERVQTLLCAVQYDGDNNIGNNPVAVNSNVRPEDFCDANTGG